MRMLDCELVINNDFVDIHFHCFNVRNSKFFIVVASLFTRSCTSDLCGLFFYEFCYVCIKATPSVSPPPQIALGICLVHVLKYCSYYVSEHEAWADKIFKRFVTLKTDYQTTRSCDTRGTPRSH